MEENFNLVAKSRANYYTPGSPVQFVQVELLKGDQSGDNAVCLTFKNIGPVTVTGLDVRFRCKAADGSVLCEEDFTYEELQAKTGDLFGMDDAVFVTEQAIGSVDVQLKTVYSGNKKMALHEKKRVRLPSAKRLPADMAARLEEKTGRKGLKYVPQSLETGWYCACGAFHPNEENTAYCSECGSDRVLLQNAVSSILQPAQPKAAEAKPLEADEPTRVGPLPTAEAKAEQPGESTRTFDAPAAPTEASGKRVKPSAAEHFVNNYKADVQQYEYEANEDADDYDEDASQDPRDVVAENIIRWVPALTVLICAAIALGGFLYCNLML